MAVVTRAASRARRRESGRVWSRCELSGPRRPSASTESFKRPPSMAEMPGLKGKEGECVLKGGACSKGLGFSEAKRRGGYWLVVLPGLGLEFWLVVLPGDEEQRPAPAPAPALSVERHGSAHSSLCVSEMSAWRGCRWGARGADRRQ